MWLSSLLALAAMWAGLSLSYAVPKLPPSFAVIATAAAFYLLAALRAQLRPRRER
jgi:zinc/manganese transport system permease protein